jgi:arabinofuranosyltransferase
MAAAPANRAEGARFVSERLFPILLLIIFAVVLLRTAWLSDDAAITFRVVLNFAHGFGPNFNLTERVQAYTHPLWFLLLIAAYFMFGNVFYATLYMCFVFALFSVWFLIARLSCSPLWASLAAVILILSKAFVDYSTSGLENPLSYLLLALFVFVFEGSRARSRTYLLKLTLLLSLLYLSRPDLVLLVAPLWLVTCRRVRSPSVVLSSSALGLVPLGLWLVFSLLYYGFPFPNTAYAKLDIGLDGWELARQGVQYFLDSLDRDPLTLAAIAFAVMAGVLQRSTLSRALALGIVLYLFYVVRIGGDFMSGRFFAVPLFAAAIIIARLPPAPARVFVFPALALVLIGLLSPNLPLASDSHYSNEKLSVAGIADERGFFYQRFGLLSGSRDRFQDLPAWPSRSSALPDIADLKEVCGGLGFDSLYAGPWIHYVDRCGISDPLLARLPPKYNPNWRAGHFERAIPENYLQSIRSSSNNLSDVQLHQFYDAIRVITRGPLFSAERFGVIVRMNLGQYDYLIDRERYGAAPTQSATAVQLSGIKPEGSRWNAPGNIVLHRYVSLSVSFDRLQLDKTELDVSFDNNDRYLLSFAKDGKLIDSIPVGPKQLQGGGLARYILKIPRSIATTGFDTIIINPDTGDDAYSIGHLVVR